MKRLVPIYILSLLISLLGIVQSPQSHAIFYSSGSYGTCTYTGCSIGLSTGGTVVLNITPTSASTVCSVQSDGVTATTESSTGYSITMTDDDTSNSLYGSNGATIPPVTGTPTSPVPLSADTWGYRVDNIAGFGSGPTSAVTNGPNPALTFAAPPLSTGSPATIRYTTTSDSSTVTTPVWFGMCASTTPKSGTYSDAVIYTALINS